MLKFKICLELPIKKRQKYPKLLKHFWSLINWIWNLKTTKKLIHVGQKKLRILGSFFWLKLFYEEKIFNCTLTFETAKMYFVPNLVKFERKIFFGHLNNGLTCKPEQDPPYLYFSKWYNLKVYTKQKELVDGRSKSLQLYICMKLAKIAF